MCVLKWLNTLNISLIRVIIPTGTLIPFRDTHMIPVYSENQNNMENM